MQRIITLKGSVVTKESNWFGGILDGNERLKAINHLTANGWGVFSLELSRQIIGSITHLGYVRYDITIQISSPLNENPNRVLQGIAGNLGAVFNGISLYVAGDDILQNNIFTPTYNTDNASYDTLPNIKDIANQFSFGAGISTPIIIAGAVVLLALYLRK